MSLLTVTDAFSMVHTATASPLHCRVCEFSKTTHAQGLGWLCSRQCMPTANLMRLQTVQWQEAAAVLDLGAMNEAPHTLATPQSLSNMIQSAAGASCLDDA